ncbi:MAG: hypothetical protein IJ227_05025 [Mogibacterium sp.]|nr:hypothetical protein [Mogibacterium sp.]
MTLAFIVAFAVVISMNMSSLADWNVWANTEEASVLESGNDAAEETSEENTEDASDAEEVTEDPAEDLGDVVIKAAAVKGDFSVEPESNCVYSGGILTVTGNVTISMAEGKPSTTDRIVVAENANVALNGVNIAASGGPAIKINAGVKATLTLADGSTNKVTGANNYAGVEVTWESESNYADLTIDGNGKILATGGGSGTGIGGSKSNQGVYGNITINSGEIEARGVGRSAGIGSSDNPNDGGSHGSYKYTEDEWGTITINGGNIKAYGQGNGAGIGGGNHTSSGKIIINDGTIYAEGDTGIGAGLGSSSGADKGPGYYFADVTINGGNITAYATDCMGAGIGGGMYSDAYVTINGGTVKASVSQDGNTYQGGAGIGGGYQGCAIVTITGGDITASGGHGAPGIGNGALGTTTSTKEYSDGIWSGTKNVRTGKPTITENTSKVSISGGDVTASGGMFAAGIGTGNCSDYCNVEISGGTVLATGGMSNSSDMEGGAGIGSGVSYASSKQAYKQETNVSITISGGDVTAIGGWGAAGVGSGAKNKTAEEITITEDAKVEAYADGTKFAIDTRQLNPDGSTTSITDGRDIDGNWIQGTFVRPYEDEQEGVDKQETAGLPSIKVINDATRETKELTGMPEGYRSFAVNVSAPGNYTVYSDECTVVDGDPVGVFFNKWTTENKDDGEIVAANIKYVVTGNGLSDNYYLYPVKTLIVTKEVVADEAIKDEIDHTLKYGLWVGGDDGHYVQKDGEKWTEAIKIENGVPQGTATFVNIESGEYGVWELDENGNDIDVSKKPLAIGNVLLTKIETKHGESGDNDGTISEKQWVDYVTVINTYEKKDPDEHLDPPDDPSENYDPDDPEKETETGKVRTGDETPLALYAGLFAAAAALLAVVGIIVRRNRNRGDGDE